MALIDAAGLFRDWYGSEASAVANAPGRVNLIGEHTDYSLLPVLPMAISRRVQVAAASSDDARVDARSSLRDETVQLETRGLNRPASWGRYLAGVVAELGDVVSGRGARIAVDSDLPATGGLSSSSALTVAVLLALGRVWDLGLTRSQIVDRAVAAERRAGTEGGRMDQTVIVHGEAGAALRIDFLPEARRRVPLREDLRFVVGYSGESAEKGASARDHYNGSVVACRCAAALLGRAAQMDPGTPPVLGRVADVIAPEMIASLPELADVRQVAEAAEHDLADLVSLTSGRFDPAAPVAVRSAARHVFSEARRVDGAEAALAGGALDDFGKVLDASHASLQDFGASTDALDALTEAARAAGAYGARLTGAGFGGWALAACDPARTGEVIDRMRRVTGGPAFEVQSGGGAR